MYIVKTRDEETHEIYYKTPCEKVVKIGVLKLERSSGQWLIHWESKLVPLKTLKMVMELIDALIE